MCDLTIHPLGEPNVLVGEPTGFPTLIPLITTMNSKLPYHKHKCLTKKTNCEYMSIILNHLKFVAENKVILLRFTTESKFKSMVTVQNKIKNKTKQNPYISP